MSLMRQVALLLCSVLLLALAGAVGINLAATRDALQTQLRVKNSDNAQNIALALGIKAVFLVLALFDNASMWMAVFADMGASLLVVFNGLRLMRTSERS